MNFRYFILIFVALFFCKISVAQLGTISVLKKELDKHLLNKYTDSSLNNWDQGVLYNLSVAQASLANWSAGGDDFSMSLSSIFNAHANYKKDKHNWDNMFDFNLGYVNSSSLGSRKNDDRFDLLSKYGYSLNDHINFTGLLNLRSQLFNGYTYEDGKANYASSFFAPGYFLSSIGLDFKKSQKFSVFASPVTTRWVIVRDTALSNKGLYGVTPGEKSNLEFGSFVTLNYLKDIAKNISLKTRLDLFSNYRRNPKNVDLFMTNFLSVSLTKIIALTWEVDFIYDDDLKLFGKDNTSPALQFKSLVGIGIQINKKR